MIIYPPDVFVNGVIPAQNDFSKALNRFEKAAVNDHIGSRVLSYMTYGSHVRGDAHRASDIDILLIIDRAKHLAVIRDAISEVYHEFGVQINTRILTAAAIEEDLTPGLDPGFSRHLAHVLPYARLLGENPLALLPNDPDPVEVSVQRSVEGYWRRLNNAYAKSGRNEDEFLGFVHILTEKPMHAMREMLHLSGSTRHQDFKKAIADTYASEYPSLFNLIQPLLGNADNYVALLNERETIPEDERKERYLHAIHGLANCYYGVERFLVRNKILADRAARSTRAQYQRIS